MRTRPTERNLRAIAAIEPKTGRVLFAAGSASALDAVSDGVTDGDGHRLSAAELPQAAAREGRPYGPADLRIDLDGASADVVVEVVRARDGAGADAGVSLLTIAPKTHEPAEDARDRFLAVATHELRSPLTSLQLDLERIRRWLGREESVRGPDVAARMDRALGQIARLTTLVQNLLDVSRMQSGRLVLSRARSDLCAIAREMIDTLRPQAAAAGTDVALTTCVPLVGMWDRVRVEQILHNLVTNAIKYGRSEAPIEVSVAAHDGAALLAVRDHGRGVAPRDRARIFAPYERADEAQAHKSLGLGLAIVREIASAHRGSVRLESPADGGSRFVVELPLVDAGPDDGPT